MNFFRIKQRIGVVLVLLLGGACGTNTDTPLFPYYGFAVIAPPAIVSVTPVVYYATAECLLSSATGDKSACISVTDQGIDHSYFSSYSYLDYLIEFDLKYYVTNGEDGFSGYNIYIGTRETSAEATLLGTSGYSLYLPTGTRPTFEHIGETPNTATIRVRRVKHHVAPPGETPFIPCEEYHFLMTAYLNTGLESEPGPLVKACAINDISLCPVGSACNP